MTRGYDFSERMAKQWERIKELELDQRPLSPERKIEKPERNKEDR